MSGTFFALNQKYNQLKTQTENALGGDGTNPTTSTLADVLLNGNSAGATDIDMNLQSITNAMSFVSGDNGNSIDVDGSSATLTLTDNLGNTNVITAIGSSVPSANADSVLTTATTTNSTFYPSFLGATTGYNSVGVSTALTFNPSTKVETLTDGVNSTTITPTAVSSTTFNGALNGNASTATKATNLAGGVASQIPYQTGANTTAFIANGTSGQYLKSNGTGAPSWDTLPAPPATPTLDQVLTAGNQTTIDIQIVNDLTTTTISTDYKFDGLTAIDTTTPFSSQANITATGMSLIDGNDNSATYEIGQIILNNNSMTQEIILTANNDPPTLFIQNGGGNYTSTLSATDLSIYDAGTTSSATWVDIINTANNPPATPDLDAVLTAGNSAGSNNIEMNNNDINNVATIHATSFVGDLTGNATSATDATNVAVSTYLTGVYYPTLVSNTTGNQGVGAKSNLTYNATTSTLNSTTFVGALTGNATSATTATTATNATNATNAINCSTTSTTTAGTYYPVFVSSNVTGNYPNLVGVMTYNPSSNTITANTFNGALSGTATNATNVGITSDNTAGTYYIPFAKTSGTGNKPLFIDDVTTPFSYNPSTGTASATAYTITGTPATASVASTFGQVGLVKITSVQVSITGSASVQNLSFSSLFNTTYKNYRIILHPTTQVSFTAVYPTYSLQAFLGTSVPTVASLFGFEMVSTASAVVSPVYTSGATLSATPLVFAVSSQPNKEIIFDIQNVGYTATQTQQVSLMCKSIYSNPGVQGASDRTISASALTNALITGLTIQQSALGVSNNMTLEMVVYGYNNL